MTIREPVERLRSRRCVLKYANGFACKWLRLPGEENGRGDWIRTNDPLLPKQVRYQTALRPDMLRMDAGVGSDL